jgi:hypothetical protein
MTKNDRDRLVKEAKDALKQCPNKTQDARQSYLGPQSDPQYIVEAIKVIPAILPAPDVIVLSHGAPALQWWSDIDGRHNLATITFYETGRMNLCICTVEKVYIVGGTVDRMKQTIQEFTDHIKLFFSSKKQ